MFVELSLEAAKETMMYISLSTRVYSVQDVSVLVCGTPCHLVPRPKGLVARPSPKRDKYYVY